jgi:hypothetical protein
MALINPYTTIGRVKTFCGIASSDTTYDTEIEDAINEASRMIDDLTDSFFYKKTYADHYLGEASDAGFRIVNGEKGRIFTPKNAPIISVTSLYESDNLLVANDDYYINLEAGIITKTTKWDVSPREIKISCAIGYNTTNTTTPSADLPGVIGYYALEIAARLSGRYTKEQPSLEGTNTAIHVREIPKWIVDKLQKMRSLIL